MLKLLDKCLTILHKVPETNHHHHNSLFISPFHLARSSRHWEQSVPTFGFTHHIPDVNKKPPAVLYLLLCPNWRSFRKFRGDASNMYNKPLLFQDPSFPFFIFLQDESPPVRQSAALQTHPCSSSDNASLVSGKTLHISD